MLPLMIIDMQEEFLNVGPCPKRLKGTIIQNAHQVQLAKRRKAPIIVVEFADRGDTVDEITRLLAQYSSVIKITKHVRDVAHDMPPRVQNLLRQVAVLRVVGVNTNECVESSVIGMHCMFPNLTIQLVRRACANCFWDRSRNGSFKWVRAFKRVHTR